MSNVKTSFQIAAGAVLLLAGSAFAATVNTTPVSGEGPYIAFDASSSQLQRAEVEAQAAAHLPVAGQFAEKGRTTTRSSQLTRAQVEAAIVHMPAAGDAMS